MSQKSISSSPMDQTSDGSWEKPPKAPRMDEAEGKITSMNRWNRAEKRHGDASPSQLCCWLTFPKISLGSQPCPQLCASVLPGRWQGGGLEHPVPTCCSLDEGAEVLHAVAPTEAPLQQPLVSSLPVQELCCGTDGIRGRLPDPKGTLQLPPERGCWRETSKSPRSGGLGPAVGCTRGACKDNWLMSGTACLAVVPLFLANVHLFLPKFGARPLLPPAMSFDPTGEAAAIYAGKALVNCLFF